MINIRLLSPNFGLFLLLVACSGLEQFLAYRTGIIAGRNFFIMKQPLLIRGFNYKFKLCYTSSNSCAFALALKQAQHLNMFFYCSQVYPFFSITIRLLYDQAMLSDLMVTECLATLIINDAFESLKAYLQIYISLFYLMRFLIKFILFLITLIYFVKVNSSKSWETGTSRVLR